MLKFEYGYVTTREKANTRPDKKKDKIHFWSFLMTSV